MPADLAARAGLYRDRLAGTHTLVVLDNAADEAQVAPLLPASDTCLVLVTSRRQLKALDDALPLPLDVLPGQEAVALLRKASRLDEHPGDRPLLEQAAELCGRLPLALLIAGALLRTGGKAWNLTVLIDRLTARRPGDELAGYTDETRNLPAVFDLSYQHLPEDLQVLFRRVGVLPGPELDAYAAAALLGSDPSSAGRLLERLAAHSLLIGAAPGRYRLHDLIRAHAQTLVVRLDRASDREAALGRLLHYYAHTAQSASISIARVPRPGPDGPAPAHAPAPRDPDAARAWLRTEYPDLEAAFAHAQLHALDRHTIALAAGLGEILQSDGPFTSAIEIHRAAAEVAERRRQPAARANALTDLGRVLFLTGDVLGAADAVALAVEISRGIGDRLGEAAALNTLGRVRYATGDFPAAVDAVAQAVAIYRRIGNRLGEAAALTTLGQVHFLTGDVLGAADAVGLAVEISREIGNRLGQAAALTTLGRVRYATGDFPGAADAQVQALEIYRQIGNRLGEAGALTNLGQVRFLTGDVLGAADAVGLAVEISREIGNRLGEAAALTTLGRVRYATGDFPGAADAQAQALEISRRIGDRGDEADALNHHAATLAATGDDPRAFALYEQALALNRELHKPDDEAISLEGIAEHYLVTGDPVQATTYLRQALEIYRRLGMRANVERVAARLASLATP
jgi:tetratricopeptide (TPR) repeat protein